MFTLTAKRYSKFLLLLALVTIGVAVAQAPAAFAAGPGTPPTPAAADHVPFGIVPPHGQASRFSGIGGNLTYHNGPVMHTNTVYAIYWVPSGYTMSATYINLINGYFSNVAADSGKTSNVYASDTQYSSILYSSSFTSANNAYTDTNALPASACSDSYTSVCVSDAQISAEIQRVMTLKGWTGGSTKLFFMFTAKGVGSCAGSSCAFTQYCAYHSWMGSGSSVVLYANMPYADTVPAACDAGQHPNNDDADATINVTSHEHNEAITDEQGSAWFDRRGYENGDKCAWNFGTMLGGSSGAQYNQVIGSGHYFLQQEWSNYSSKCVLTGK